MLAGSALENARAVAPVLRAEGSRIEVARALTPEALAAMRFWGHCPRHAEQTPKQQSCAGAARGVSQRIPQRFADRHDTRQDHSAPCRRRAGSAAAGGLVPGGEVGKGREGWRREVGAA